MTGSMLERVLRHDRYIVVTALVAMTVAAWLYILWLAAAMYSPDMSSGPAWMHAMMMAPAAPWTAADFVFVLSMWVFMMLGMMMPSAAPMIQLYRRVGLQAARDGKRFAAVAWFVFGYLSVWTLFSVGATLAQWGLARASLLTPMMAIAGTAIGPWILIGTGIYQWTPFKQACLSQCQFPLAFIQRHGGFRADAAGSLRLGMLHGLYCLGCCWALMALLFVVGIMNPLWIAALTMLIVLEKLAAPRRFLARLAGILFILAGIWMMVFPIGSKLNATF